MTSVVITLIGNDRAGLVDTVASVVAEHGGNWERSHLSELAGKFAGIVQVAVAEASVAALLGALEQIEAQGLLAITAEQAMPVNPAEPARHVALELVGQDHPGIVQQISGALARSGVSIDELETAVVPAPQEGRLFIANAVLEVPASTDLKEMTEALEAVALDLMVDLDVIAE